MKAMILAAGLGTRLRPVTEQYAKPAVPFLNVPLLYYPLSLLEQAGLESLVLNTHHKPEQIETLAARIPGAHYSVAFSHESAAPLGSGGGIWNAQKLLEGSGDFLVSNGDEVILPHDSDIIAQLISEHRANQNLATLLVMHHPLVGTQFGGVWTDAANNVRGFGKDGSKFGVISKDVFGHHYIGVLLLNDRVFSYLPEGESNILYDALAAAIANGERVVAKSSAFTWYETGNPRDFLHASGEALKLLKSRQGPNAQFLERITRRFWEPGTQLEEKDEALILHGTDCRIAQGVSVSGFAVFGNKCVVKSGVQIRNSVLLPGARIQYPEIVNDAIVVP